MSTCHYRQQSLRAWCCPPRDVGNLMIPRWLFGVIDTRSTGAIVFREDNSPLLEGETLVELPDGLIKRFTSKEFEARFEWDVYAEEAMKGL